MAADTVGLLDVLGLDCAHLVGLSQGGMIAQTVAIEYPGRVRSLTSIASRAYERGHDFLGRMRHPHRRARPPRRNDHGQHLRAGINRLLADTGVNDRPFGGRRRRDRKSVATITTTTIVKAISAT
jgi:pimeloyl-ACP methyl ester carboxylesterase